MAGVLFLTIVLNAILFSGIFWFLTFISKTLYSNSYTSYKLNFYECGFKNMTKKNISYDINYVMVLLFLLIYDGEFLILIPFAFNITFISMFNILAISFFLVWLLIALFYDYAFNALEWQN